MGTIVLIGWKRYFAVPFLAVLIMFFVIWLVIASPFLLYRVLKIDK